MGLTRGWGGGNFGGELARPGGVVRSILLGCSLGGLVGRLWMNAGSLRNRELPDTFGSAGGVETVS